LVESGNKLSVADVVIFGDLIRFVHRLPGNKGFWQKKVLLALRNSFIAIFKNNSYDKGGDRTAAFEGFQFGNLLQSHPFGIP
jgi:hypothetical protein